MKIKEIQVIQIFEKVILKKKFLQKAYMFSKNELNTTALNVVLDLEKYRIMAFRLCFSFT